MVKPIRILSPPAAGPTCYSASSARSDFRLFRWLLTMASLPGPTAVPVSGIFNPVPVSALLSSNRLDLHLQARGLMWHFPLITCLPSSSVSRGGCISLPCSSKRWGETNRENSRIVAGRKQRAEKVYFSLLYFICITCIHPTQNGITQTYSPGGLLAEKKIRHRYRSSRKEKTIWSLWCSAERHLKADLLNLSSLDF